MLDVEYSRARSGLSIFLGAAVTLLVSLSDGMNYTISTAEDANVAPVNGIAEGNSTEGTQPCWRV